MTKQCTICKRIKPFEEFYKDSHSRKIDGHYSACKVCHNEISKKKGKEYRIKAKKYENLGKKTRQCKVCGETKSVNEFFSTVIGKRGYLYKKRVCKTCKGIQNRKSAREWGRRKYGWVTRYKKHVNQSLIKKGRPINSKKTMILKINGIQIEATLSQVKELLLDSKKTVITENPTVSFAYI